MINSYAHGGIKYRLAGQGIGLDDFYSYMERANAYFWIPTGRSGREVASMTASRRCPLLDAKGQPVLDERGSPKFIPASNGSISTAGSSR